MKFILSIYLLLLSITFSFSDTTTISLSRAVNRTLKVLPQLKSATGSWSLANLQRKEVQTSWYPIITSEYLYAFSQPTHEITIGSQTMKMSPDHVYDAHIGFLWELPDIKKYSIDKKIADAGIEQANRREELLSTMITYQVVALWFGILYDKSAISIQDSLIAAYTAHRDFIKLQIETGSAISYDLSKTNIRISNAQSQLVSLYNDYGKRMNQLRTLIAVDINDSLILTDSDTIFKISSDSKESFVYQAFENRIELKLAINAQYRAELKYEAIKRSYRPTLSLQGSAGIKDGYPVTHNGKMMLEYPILNATAGVHLNVPIWDGNRLKSELYESGFAIAFASDSVDCVKHRITDEVLNAYADYNSSLEQTRIAEQLVTEADTIAKAASVRYESGMATNLEYLDAQGDRALALLNKSTIHYRHLLNSMLLLQATGVPLFFED